MEKKITASVRHGKNKVEFTLGESQASKVLRLQNHIRKQRQENELANQENRKPNCIKY